MITANIFIEDIVRDYPEVIQPLANNKSVTDLEKIIKELNELV